MIQKRDDLPLSQEPAPEFLVFSVRQPQNLDGYLLRRLLRACGKVNISVSTGTQPPVDLVGANFPVGHRILYRCFCVPWTEGALLAQKVQHFHEEFFVVGTSGDGGI